MQSNVVCPVSDQRVNESVVRTVAAFIFVISTVVLFTGIKWLAVFLIIDFAIRAFSNGDFSVLKQVSKKVASAFKFTAKPIDAAPKKFAALVGVVFSVVIAITLFLGWNVCAIAFNTVLIICAGLEAFAGYCVGCQFYSWIVLPARKIFNKA
jgi:hypothetical protein